MDEKTDYSSEVERLQEMRDRDIYKHPPSPSMTGQTWREAYFEECYKVDSLSRRLSLAEQVVEAADKLMKHAMPIGCNCAGCTNMRAALAALKEKEGKV